MLQDVEANANPGFKGGLKRGVGQRNESVQCYESFTLNGLEYSLYDSVYMYHAGETETSIGKILKMYETASHEKRLEVVWLFRPSEIRNFIGDAEPRWNELLLASGDGVGLSNVCPLDAIVGKCNVVCTSKDPRNPPVLEAEMEIADYFFGRTFDVEKQAISEKFPDKIGGIKVENFFNRRKDQNLVNPSVLKANLKDCTVSSNLSCRVGLHKVTENVSREAKNAETAAGRQGCSFRNNPAFKPVTVVSQIGTVPGRASFGKVERKAEQKFSGHLSPLSAPELQPSKKRKLPQDAIRSACQNADLSLRLNAQQKTSKFSDKTASQCEGDQIIESNNKAIDVSRRIEADISRCFKPLPWKERLEMAQGRGTLVLMENLDSSCTSSEVEDLVLLAFSEQVEAKIIVQSTLSCSTYGKALVVFKSKDAAESALSMLNNRCLMLENGRVIAGCRGVLFKHVEPKPFVGHYKFKQQRMTQEMKNAVSTAHVAQVNTIEYEMAMQWRLLQERSDTCWKTLHEQQEKRIATIKNQLKVERGGCC